jgi:hypothetical protein
MEDRDFSYLDRSVNPWDVWGDDTAERGRCPERITDLDCAGNVQKFRAVLARPPAGITVPGLVGGHRPPNWALAGGKCPPYLGKLPLAGRPKTYSSSAFQEWIGLVVCRRLGPGRES